MTSAQPEAFGSLVARRVAEDPKRLIVADGPVQLSRHALFTRALQLGGALVRRGLHPGSVVGFQLPNWSEACVISLACALHGFVLCPLLLMYRERELGIILAGTSCDALFMPAVFRNTDYRAMLLRTPLDLGHVQVFSVRSGGSESSYESLLAEPEDVAAPPPVDGADVKTIIYTSGTTGHPKGVVHTHDTLLATYRRSAAFWGLTESDRLLVPSPVGHIGGSMYAFDLPWLTGCTAYLMEKWDAAEAVAMIEREGITFCAGATPFLQSLLDTAVGAGSALPSLRRFVCGGASVQPRLVEAASNHFTSAVVSRAYGSTEVPLVCAGVRSRNDARHGQITDGEIGVELRLADGDGDEPVPDGAEGDILVRSPGMFRGYLHPADDVGQFTPDGFFRTGDIGRLVDGRYLEITGRRKELIIRMGENISPLEIETVLLLCEAVERVAVVGIPDARTGERAAAFVTLKPGHTLTLADMQAFLAGAGLARQKFPEDLHVMASIPTNSVGKIVKAELKRIAIAGAEP